MICLNSNNNKNTHKRLGLCQNVYRQVSYGERETIATDRKIDSETFCAT